MNYCRLVSTLIFFLVSSVAWAQTSTVSLIGSSEEFLLESVKDYASVHTTSLEHEEFDVLVFADSDRELSCYFTFYKGGKMCNYIKRISPLWAIKPELDLIKSEFTNVKDDVWENSEKTVQVQIKELDGQVTMLLKEIR